MPSAPDAPGHHEAPHDTGFSSAEQMQDLRPEATDPLPHTEAEIKAHTRFRFILCTHTEEFADRVAEAAADFDVILLETTNQTTDRRSEVEAEVNRFLAEDANDDLDTNVVTDTFLATIARRAKGHTRTIKLVDYLVDVHPQTKIKSELSDAAYQMASERRSNMDPNRDVEHSMMVADAISGSYLKDRDRIVGEDVIRATRQEEVIPDTVAVIQGTIHTGTYHRFKRENFQADRVFINPPVPNPREKAHFNRFNQPVREVSVGNQAHPRPETVRAEHLYMLLVGAAELPSDQAENTLLHASTQDIGRILAGADAIKADDTMDEHSRYSALRDYLTECAKWLNSPENQV